MSLEYKVVEIAKVNDSDLEEVLNQHSAEDWNLDRIDYIMQTGVRRPQMAFVFFSRQRPAEGSE